MGDNADGRAGPQSGSSGNDSGAVDDPLTQTDVKVSRSGFDCRKPEQP